MMDTSTIECYDVNHEAIEKLHKSLIPNELYNLASKFFVQGLKTIDVGCGTGRDSDWLSKNGFPVVGIDASHGMLHSAKNTYPDITFKHETLPTLQTIQSTEYHNVLCSAVLMHLPYEQIESAVVNLLRITKPEGIVLLSYRGSTSTDNRESGKLYTPISHQELIENFVASGARLLTHEASFEEERGHYWNSMVFRK